MGRKRNDIPYTVSVFISVNGGDDIPFDSLSQEKKEMLGICLENNFLRAAGYEAVPEHQHIVDEAKAEVKSWGALMLPESEDINGENNISEINKGSKVLTE